jgi:hypothetical protein
MTSYVNLHNISLKSAENDERYTQKIKKIKTVI